MGWISAVSLFQHLQRRISLLPYPHGASLPAESEWRRDAPLPIGSAQSEQSWFQVYLDDFDAPIIVPEKQLHLHENSPSEMLALKRRANAQWGILHSDEKAEEGSTSLVRMGAEIDGVVGRVGVPCTKLLENCSFGLWLLSEPLCNCKGLAMFPRAFSFPPGGGPFMGPLAIPP